MKKAKTLKKIRFTDGHEITTKLSAEEAVKRMNRLDTLRVRIEECDCDAAQSIVKKALRAYDKEDNFTGIIRLSFWEKDWLAYCLESDFNDEEEIEAIKFYCGITE
jgi:hypothetical protein